MRIFVEQLEFVGAHGVYEEERREGRRFSVDLAAIVPDAERAGGSDALGDTLDYRDLATLILDVARGDSCALVERLAAQILDRLFDAHASVRSAEVTIRKFATGVPGEPRCVGVSLSRQRQERDHV